MLEIYNDPTRLSVVLRAFFIDADFFKSDIESAGTALLISARALFSQALRCSVVELYARHKRPWYRIGARFGDRANPTFGSDNDRRQFVSKHDICVVYILPIFCGQKVFSDTSLRHRTLKLCAPILEVAVDKFGNLRPLMLQFLLLLASTPLAVLTLKFLPNSFNVYADEANDIGHHFIPWIELHRTAHIKGCYARGITS